MIYTTDLGDKLVREVAIAKDAACRCCWMMLPVFHRPTTKAVCQDEDRPLYVFRRQRPAGTTVQRRAAGPEGFDRSGAAQFKPVEGAVCRPMKVGKEEVIGCLTAVETWLKIDSKKLYENGTPG